MTIGAMVRIPESIVVQQGADHLLFCDSDEALMPFSIHLPDEMFKEVNVCRMADVNDDIHAGNLSDNISLPFFSEEDI